MTDLKKIKEAFDKNKDKLITKEFWDKANEKYRENQRRFVERDRKLMPKTN